jgi:hypothetical protein
VTIILLIIASFIAVSKGAGQGTSASLTGSVNDSTGAAIAGAHVTAQNIETNLTQSVDANGAGVYGITQLPPGPYKITVESQGYQTYVQTGIVLTVNQSATLNIQMQVGDVKQSIRVSANAALINTSNAELSSVVNQYAVSQLPLNGRDPSSLVLLAPGVTNILNSNGALQAGFSFPTETGGSANGGRQGSTFYLLDGVPNMDNYLLLTAPFPNADATQEFRVITNNFDARYGFSPGAVVSIETKSGTNEFHGGVFEFLRNQDLNATNWFSRQVDPLKRNQFGAYGGGPILKDKFFVFVNYQGTRSSSSSTANQTYTPTAAMLNGDFSGVTTTLGAPFATVNGKPNQVDPSLFSTAAVTLSKTALPQGQAPDGETYYSSGKIINSFNEGTARLDYTINDKQRLTLRSFVDYLTEPSGDVNGNILSVLQLNPYADVFNEDMEYYNEVLNHTWVINPNTVNVLSLFWSQMSAHNSAATRDSSGQNVCLSRYIAVTELPGQCYIEGLSVSGGFQSGWTEPSQQIRSTYGLYDTFTKTIGNHALSAGLNLQHQSAYQDSQYPTQPIVDFYGTYTGNGLADFLLGKASEFTQGAGEIVSLSGWQPGLFAQDQYRVKPNITITAGLRWDPNIAPTISGGRAATYVAGQQSTVFPNAPTGMVFPGDKGISGGLMATTYGYWEPRVGVAWQPRAFPHTAIHAGFGLFTAPLMSSMYSQMVNVSPFSPIYNFQGGPTTPISFQNPWASYTGTNGQNPFPPFASLSYKPPQNVSFLTPVTIPATLSPNFKLGITQSWNISIDQELGHDMAAHLAYVGSESYHQSTIIDQNPGIYRAPPAGSPPGTVGMGVRGNPNFSEILTDFSNTTASYNALQATLEKHFSHGLQFQSNFTWSKTLDIASSGNITYGTNQLPDPFDLRWNRGISLLNFPFISVTNFIYTTPELHGHNALLQDVLGQWEISGIVTAQSGSPFGINSGTDNSGSLQNNQDRADVVPGQPSNVHRGTKDQWLNEYFNTAAFTTNAAGTFGNSSKNMFKSPTVNTADLGLIKNWNLVQNYKLQFRWEMFNAFNHPNFGTPGNTVGYSNYGEIESLGAVPPRVMQAAVKITF